LKCVKHKPCETTRTTFGPGWYENIKTMM